MDYQMKKIVKRKIESIGKVSPDDYYTANAILKDLIWQIENYFPFNADTLQVEGASLLRKFKITVDIKVEFLYG